MISIELWGTFSVRDHLVVRAFVADVLLYDRLVIPTLPENAPENEWPAVWDQPKQRALLRDLGDIAIPIPWDDQRRGTWQKRFEDKRADERRLARSEMTAMVRRDVETARNPETFDLPYRITREVLQDFVNDNSDGRLLKKLRVTRKVRPGSVLQAVSAYPSFDAFAADVPEARAVDREENALAYSPTHVFGWQFFVPDSANLGEDEDRRLLEMAMKLATKTEFVAMRGEFYKWWNDVTESGLSAAETKEDMEKRITEYQQLIKGEGWKTATRYAIKLADAFTGGIGLVNEVAAAGTQAFLGSADILADERLKRENAPPRLKVAAIFHDARTRLGWKTPK